jgi:hypothetical protein
MMQSNIECAIYAANMGILRILSIIKCIFDIEVTFITSLMFVIDVQADIFSMQYASIFAIFAYSQRI